MSDVVRVEVNDETDEFEGVVEGLVPEGYDEVEASIYSDGFEDGVIAALNYYHAS